MNLRYFNSQLELFWRTHGHDFPGFDAPKAFPAATIAQNCPMYVKRFIDRDPDSIYLFIKGDPLRHQDITRQKACELFDRLFYDHMGMPSSYDIQSGMSPTQENPQFGTMTREEAINMEVLPAADDQLYRSYYDEQMAKIDPEIAAAEKEAKRQEKINKLGFDPDDPNIIDVEVVGEEPAAASSRSVGSAQSTAVGMPKPIFYAVCAHVPAAGGLLGHNRGDQRLDGRGRGRGGYLRENKAKLKKSCRKGLCEAELTQDDIDDIADMFASYGGISYGNNKIAQFIRQHEDELKALVSQRTDRLGDFAGARDLDNDDELNEGSISLGMRAAIIDLRKAIDALVKGNVGGKGFESEANKLFDKYFSGWGVNECDSRKNDELAETDDIETDEADECLDESFIRHCNFLGKE